MTREEAVKKLEANSMDCDYHEVSMVETDIAINTVIQVVDDFESRTCESCKFNYKLLGNVNYCALLEQDKMKHCSEWESK